MKKLLSLLSVLMLSLTFINPIHANDDVNINEDPNYYSEENIKEREELIEKVASYPMPLTADFKYLNTQEIAQEKFNYCCPASVQILLKYLGKNYSQTTLAGSSYLHTDQIGNTGVEYVEPTLNKILGAGTYKAMRTYDLSLSSGVSYSLNKGYPVILNPQMEGLPGYEGREVQHYVVGDGYLIGMSGTTGSSDIRYNDPNNLNPSYGTFGHHTVRFTQMIDALNANYGYYWMTAK